MHNYQRVATDALHLLNGALFAAEVILPRLVRAHYWQVQKAGTLDGWRATQFWYQAQPEWTRPVATILSDLVLLSDAKAKLVTAVKGEPVHEPNITLPKVRRTP